MRRAWIRLKVAWLRWYVSERRVLRLPQARRHFGDVVVQRLNVLNRERRERWQFWIDLVWMPVLAVAAIAVTIWVGTWDQ